MSLWSWWLSTEMQLSKMSYIHKQIIKMNFCFTSNYIMKDVCLHNQWFSRIYSFQFIYVVCEVYLSVSLRHVILSCTWCLEIWEYAQSRKLMKVWGWDDSVPLERICHLCWSERYRSQSIDSSLSKSNTFTSWPN